MASQHHRSSEAAARFAAAVKSLDRRFGPGSGRHLDENQDREVRKWLDVPQPLEWAGPGVTPDEWFFITTLYGEMTLDGQRTHIRTFFPRFVKVGRRDIRNMTPSVLSDWKLRSAWMKHRLSRMALLLRQRRLTMAEYVQQLQTLDLNATPENPMPALDQIIADHRATGWKTLSVFVRDCVRGTCFPIDTRVEKKLLHYGLPMDERLLVSLSLAQGQNPRQIARMFFEAGGS